MIPEMIIAIKLLKNSFLNCKFRETIDICTEFNAPKNNIIDMTRSIGLSNGSLKKSAINGEDIKSMT
jgi:hypothetical protein